MEPDPDDIIRVINLESANDCAAEIKKLIHWGNLISAPLGFWRQILSSFLQFNQKKLGI